MTAALIHEPSMHKILQQRPRLGKHKAVLESLYLEIPQRAFLRKT